MERTLWDSPQRQIKDREHEPDTVLREKFKQIANEIKIHEEELKKKGQVSCEDACESLATILR